MIRNFALVLSLVPVTAWGAVDFNRQIRPILSDRCFTCHGPDAAAKKIKLRLDSEAGMLADLGGGRAAVVPGKPEQSELVKRIAHEKPALRMPPAYSKLSLNESEIGLLRQWVTEGAKWQKHWSLIPPVRPELPVVKNPAWAKTGIDRFVLARLEKEGLAPATQTDRATWLRRASLDLTGIPPTLAELDAFLAEAPSEKSYEKQVDRLLASSRYGEKMAGRWLDVARYADTNGYQTDGERSMWRWRDWVIAAFNRNLPFDQFTIEQLAGDLLPNPTREQLIATGFNRNHRGNGEGGIVPEEYQVEYAADRAETTSTVWLGLTMGCARCHNHKYDPLTQKDYYQMFAYFNNVPDRGRYFKFGNTPPVVPAPTVEQDAQLREVELEVSAAEKRYQSLEPRIASEQQAWIAGLARNGSGELDWKPSRALAAQVVTAGASFDGKAFQEVEKVAELGYFDAFSISAWIKPEVGTGSILTRTKDLIEEAGIIWALKDGKLHLSMAARWLDDGLRVESKTPVPLGEWHQVGFSYDASRMAEGIHLYVDGREVETVVLLDDLNQEFRTKEPWRVGGGGGKEFLYRGQIEDVRVYQRVLTAREIEVLSLRTKLAAIAAKQTRTAAEEYKLRMAFLEEQGPVEVREAWKQRVAARLKRETMLAGFPTVMVMREMENARETFLLNRGAYDRPGEKVTANVPESLPQLPAGVPNNRLAFAKWLVDAENPLTARVMVNRIWQMIYGVGLVKTVEDFGSQGEPPSHPEMLDWLAVELRESGWDLKALQKQIVLSATYRQESRAPQELVARDPENRLLARGPRVRLPAETVRDQALALSGLLVEKVGGPSVKPYQPAGLWKELTGGADYVADKGEGLYRRSLYTFWKRTSPPPGMMNFDAAGRETCIVRENRTNTPLQALNLMNDVTYLEASRKMAERMLKEGGMDAAARIGYGFRLATARQPRDAERDVLLAHYRTQLDFYQTDKAAAAKFLQQGDSARDASLPAGEVAAMASVASLILNLDETITKQ